jgi:hypothetical protein
MAEKQIGVISNFFDHVSVAAVKLTSALKVGDTIRILGGDQDFTHVVDSMQIQLEKVAKAKKGDEVGIKISDTARKGYKIFKV